MHSIMELDLLDYINVYMKWNITKKVRTSLTRRPRKLKAAIFELGTEIHRTSAFETNKPGTDVLGPHYAEKISDAPSKKRRLLHQSPPPPPQTPCLNGQSDMSPRSQTPSVHHEDFGQQFRSNSLSQSQKRKSKTRSRNSNILKPTKKEVFHLDDFSGIELLADAACSSFIHDNEDHVNGLASLKVNSCTVDIKETIVTTESNCSSIPDTQKTLPSEGSRLHWDLNAFVDDWDKPCDDLLVEPHSQKNCSEDKGGLLSAELNLEGAEERSIVKQGAAISEFKNCDGGSIRKTYKTLDRESSVSKSDVVDSLTPSGKCEDYSTSTTSVLQQKTIVKRESDTIEKVTPEDPVSDCCGSNVTMDKVEVGYDSPFEDGELREPIGCEDNEVEKSDNIYKDDFGTMENPFSEKVEASCDHGQTMEDQSSLLVKESVPNSDTEQRAEADIFSARVDENVCRNGACVQRTRSSNIGDSYYRPERDLGVEKSMRRDKVSFQDSYRNEHSRNYNPRGGGYRTQNRRPPPSEQRNNGYVSSSHRGPPVRSHSRDRYRGGYGFHPPGFRRGAPEEEYYDPKLCYLDRKSHGFSPNFNRPVRRSRSRSRSGSPIAWHFQKRGSLDKSNSVEREAGGFDDWTSSGGGQFRDKRRSPVTMIQRNQRSGPERLKSDDHFRFSQPPARFSQMTGPFRDHKDDALRKHDGHGYYEKVNRVGRFDDGGDMKRFRYADSFSRDARNRHSCFKDAAGTVKPDGKS